MARSTKEKVRIDFRDYRNAFAVGLILGMLIIGLPHLIGTMILFSLLVLTLKLVEKGRV